MRYSLRLVIYELPKTQADVMTKWQRQNYRQEWHARVAAEIGNALPPRPLEAAALRYTRHSTTPPDYDNLVTSFKAVQDGLVHAGVLEDDKMRHTRGFHGDHPEYHWVKAKRGEGYVVVEVEER